MLYLIDANVVIDANRDYYRIGKVPEFWEWLAYNCEQGRIEMPQEIYDEVNVESVGDGQPDKEFLNWMREHKDQILLKETSRQRLVNEILTTGYDGPNLTEIDIGEIGRDPFFIAYAYASKERKRTIVTTEVSAPSKKGKNRKVPDVCKQFGIPCIHTYDLTRVLNFSTSWRT